MVSLCVVVCLLVVVALCVVVALFVEAVAVVCSSVVVLFVPNCELSHSVVSLKCVSVKVSGKVN